MLFSKVHNLSSEYLKRLRHSFFQVLKLAFIVLPFFLLQPAFAKTVFASEIENTAWLAVIQNLPEDKGSFNSALRQGVRDNLVLPNIAVDWNADDASGKQQQLIQRLKVLDSELSKYVRVSESISRFEQLKRLMPALTNIEERKLIVALLKKQQVKIPRLRNDRLLPFLDKRIAVLANSLIFNMKALVREHREYEPQLMAAMAKFGVKFSARIPDFVLDYQLIPDGQDEQGNWLFEGYIALLGKYEIQIVSVEDSLITEAVDELQAQEKSMDALAESITEKLKQFLLTHS